MDILAIFGKFHNFDHKFWLFWCRIWELFGVFSNRGAWMWFNLAKNVEFSEFKSISKRLASIEAEICKCLMPHNPLLCITVASWPNETQFVNKTFGYISITKFKKLFWHSNNIFIYKLIYHQIVLVIRHNSYNHQSWNRGITGINIGNGLFWFELLEITQEIGPTMFRCFLSGTRPAS